MTANLLIKHIIRHLPIALALLCGCSNVNPVPAYSDKPQGLITIAHLKTLATSESHTITEDISIEGFVVANDLYGEFYKSIVLCDKSGGVEISLDLRSTAKVFPNAAKVIVHCTSLTIGNYAGRVMLGSASDDYAVGRIKESDLARHFSIDKLSAQVIEPTRITIPEISPTLIGNYIEIEDVAFSEDGSHRWCDTDSETGKPITTERELYDKQGNSILVRTIAQCSYANETLPKGRGRIRGIVEKQNNRYSLRVVNRQFDFRE